jgi:short-subunit dehydrogenase
VTAVTDLDGARALVTGATGGLGPVIATALQERGAQLVLTGRRADPLGELAARLGAHAVVADLSDPSAIAPLLDEAGDVDLLVANAALPASGDLADYAQDEIDRALQVNLDAPIALTRALLPRFRERRSGHFLYVSSLSGLVGTRGASLYSATKFGLRGFAGGLRSDLQRSGVGCSIVSPGFVRDAGMYADTGVPLPPGVRTVTPEAVAAAVVRAIEHNRAEIVVAPLPVKVGARIGQLMPGIAARFQARVGGGVAARIAEAQRVKR